MLDSAGSTLVEWGRQQQQQTVDVLLFFMHPYTSVCFKVHIAYNLSAFANKIEIRESKVLLSYLKKFA